MDKSFGKNLKRLRQKRGLTLEDLAEKVNARFDANFNKSMISKWENGYEAKLQSVKYLSAFFNVSLNEMLGFNEEVLEREDDMIKIPILGEISAGDPILAEENILGYASKPPMLKLKGKSLKDLFYLKIKGDSMDLIYPDGSFVLVRQNVIYDNGDNAVVLINDENEATLKKIKIEDNLLTLIPVSKNPEHLPRTIDINKTRVQAIGKAIGYYKEH